MLSVINVLLVLLGILILLLLWVMVYDTTHFQVTTYEIKDMRIRKNFRAIVLADLHNNCYGRENKLLLDRIDQEEPDLILIAGDMLTAKPKKDYSIALNLVAQLSKKYPLCYGVGNHEHRMGLYPQVYGDMAERYEEDLQKAGVLLMKNTKRIFEEYGICVFGSVIAKEFYKRFRTQDMPEKYMQGLLGNPEKNFYNILLAHDPDYFLAYAKWGADLTLSGHVHGGVVRIPILKRGLLSPQIRFFPTYDGGVYREEDKTMILSRGLGCHTIPFRLFNPGDLIVIDFASGEGEILQKK